MIEIWGRDHPISRRDQWATKLGLLFFLLITSVCWLSSCFLVAEMVSESGFPYHADAPIHDHGWKALLLSTIGFLSSSATTLALALTKIENAKAMHRFSVMILFLFMGWFASNFVIGDIVLRGRFLVGG